MQWGLTAVRLDDTAFKQSKKVHPGYLYRNEKTTWILLAERKYAKDEEDGTEAGSTEV